MDYCAALFLCLAALCARPCHPAAVFSEDGKHAEEEILDKNLYLEIFILKNEFGDAETGGTTYTGTDGGLKSSSSYSSSQEGDRLNNESISSQSMEITSSEESSQKKKVKKRSLDSKPESVNSIGTTSNQTIAKPDNDLDKSMPSLLESSNSTLVTEYLVDDSSKESATENKNSTTKIKTEIATESGSETTIQASEFETIGEIEISTTEAGGETTIEAQVETETEIEGSGTEKEPEVNYATALEVNSEKTESTSELKEKAPEGMSDSSEGGNNTESDSTLTTTEETYEKTQSSSEENENVSPTNISSTLSTEIESSTSEDDPRKTMIQLAMDRVNRLSDQIRLVLITYRKAGVVKLPGASIFQDPMPMQDFQKSFSIGTMDFKNMRVFGLQNFTVEHINTDVDRMQVYILLHMKRLVILGNYTLRTFFSRAAGPFNVTLLNVDSEGVAEVQTAPEGHLEAADSVMDMFTQDMKVDFKNLGFMGSMFQGMVSTVGDALFNSIKPQILERINLIIRSDVNKKLKDFSIKFINKVNPVDLAFSEGRRYCRTHGYDPYHIKDHNFILGGLVYVNVTEFWVEGLSRFYRVGNLSLSMDAGVIEVSAHVMTGKLAGHCHWSGQTFGIFKYGKTNFTVDHLQVRALVHQSLDITKKPQLHDLDLELGWVKVTMDSPMTLTLMIEGIINAFPRLIRHIIVDTLEQPLKEKIQEILDKINVESIVDEHLPRLDSFGL